MDDLRVVWDTIAAGYRINATPTWYHQFEEATGVRCITDLQGELVAIYA